MSIFQYGEYIAAVTYELTVPLYKEQSKILINEYNIFREKCKNKSFRLFFKYLTNIEVKDYSFIFVFNESIYNLSEKSQEKIAYCVIDFIEDSVFFHNWVMADHIDEDVMHLSKLEFDSEYPDKMTLISNYLKFNRENGYDIEPSYIYQKFEGRIDKEVIDKTMLFEMIKKS